MNDQDRSTVLKIVCIVAILAIAVVVTSSYAVLLAGLYDERVDNKEIFRIIGPNIGVVTGGLISLVTGIVAMTIRSDARKPEAALEPPAEEPGGTRD